MWDLEGLKACVKDLKVEKGTYLHENLKLGGYTLSLHTSRFGEKTRKEFAVVSGEKVWLTFKDATDSEVLRALDFIDSLAQKEIITPVVGAKATFRGINLHGKCCTYHNIWQGLDVLRTFIGDFKVELENPIFLGRYESVKSCEKIRVDRDGSTMFLIVNPSNSDVEELLFFLDYVSQLGKNIER